MDGPLCDSPNLKIGSKTFAASNSDIGLDSLDSTRSMRNNREKMNSRNKKKKF